MGGAPVLRVTNEGRHCAHDRRGGPEALCVAEAALAHATQHTERRAQIVDAEHDRGEAAEIFLSVWGGADHRAALQK